MNITIEFKDGEKAEYKNVKHMGLGINENYLLDRLELSVDLSYGEQMNIVFVDEAVSNIAKVYRNGEEIIG